MSLPIFLKKLKFSLLLFFASFLTISASDFIEIVGFEKKINILLDIDFTDSQIEVDSTYDLFLNTLSQIKSFQVYSSNKQFQSIIDYRILFSINKDFFIKIQLYDNDIIIYESEIQTSQENLMNNIYLLLNDIVYNITYQNPYFENKILYIKENKGTRNLFIVDKNGYRQKKIDFIENQNINYVYTPIQLSGNMFAFTDMSSGSPSVKIFDLKDRKIKLIETDFKLDTTLSPSVSNKNILSFIRIGNKNFYGYLVDFNKNTISELIKKPNIVTNFAICSNKKDQHQIEIYIKNKDIYKINNFLFDSKITYHSNKEMYLDAKFSHDCRYILFTKYSELKYHIGLIDLEDDNKISILHSNQYSELASFNQDDNEILFTTRDSKESNKYIKIIDKFGYTIQDIKIPNEDIHESTWYFQNYK